MADYAAEQEMELEALRAILMDEMHELKDDPPGDWPAEAICYRIAIRTDEVTTPGEQERKMDLLFAHTPSYPDEAPLAKISSVQGMSVSEVAEVKRLVEDQISESLGMAMIYTIVGALQEWLITQASGAKETGFEIDAREQERLQKEAEEQRLAAIRAHGTPVSLETFVAWQTRFRAERELQRAQLEPDAAAAAAAKDKGPTGKAFFLAQEANGAKEDVLADSEASEDEYASDLEEDDDEDDEEELLEELLAQQEARIPA